MKLLTAFCAGALMATGGWKAVEVLGVAMIGGALLTWQLRFIARGKR